MRQLCCKWIHPIKKLWTLDCATYEITYEGMSWILENKRKGGRDFPKWVPEESSPMQ